MDEWADENGNVAPLTYGAGLGYSFLNHFLAYRIREDLRPARDHWLSLRTELRANDAYSNVIDEVTGGGVDVIYTATGWPGHTAFIDPRSEGVQGCLHGRIPAAGLPHHDGGPADGLRELAVPGPWARPVTCGPCRRSLRRSAREM